MGRSLSNDVGVGFVLNWGEDGDELTDHQKEILSNYVEDYEGDDDYDDIDEAYYDMLSEIVKKYPLLKVEMSYFEDYSYGYAVLVKNTICSSYGSILELDPAKFSISNEEFDELTKMMYDLGIQTNPKIISMVSFG
jgi:hypothetical protein